jgi:hypothetical protein
MIQKSAKLSAALWKPELTPTKRSFVLVDLNYYIAVALFLAQRNCFLCHKGDSVYESRQSNRQKLKQFAADFGHLTVIHHIKKFSVAESNVSSTFHTQSCRSWKTTWQPVCLSTIKETITLILCSVLTLALDASLLLQGRWTFRSRLSVPIEVDYNINPSAKIKQGVGYCTCL